MITELLINEIFGDFYSFVKKKLKDQRFELPIRTEDLTSALNIHSKLLNSWMSFVNFKELRSPQNLGSVYIDLDIQLTPKKLLPPNAEIEKFSIEEILKRDFHHVILGDVGAGKTTTLKHICQKLTTDESYTRYSFPLLIRLRDLDSNESIFEKLSRMLGLNLKYLGDSLKMDSQDRYQIRRVYDELIQVILVEYLELLKPIILIDGYDELSNSQQQFINKELNTLFHSIENARIILTCRSAAYDITIENSETFEICSLNNTQIEKFVYKWMEEDNYETKTFLDQLKQSPFNDTAIRPLTLVHLCALYKKYRSIPKQPKSVYKRIVNLLIEEWDIQRGIRRTSAFSDFEIDKKLDFLYRLAYEITVNTESKRFSEELLLRTFDAVHSNFGISKLERRKVIKEIESDTGLILKVDYDNFEFAHTSIQEYLTAEYIVKLPIVYNFDLYTKNLMNELAIATCLSSEPTLYFASLAVSTFPQSKISKSKISIFLKRLSIENPDFNNSILTAVGIFKIFTDYYVSDKIDSNDFAEFKLFWDLMIKNRKVEESILSLKDIYYSNEEDKDIKIYKKDTARFISGFDYPDILKMNKFLFDF